jgi:hypothetical protein
MLLTFLSDFGFGDVPLVTGETRLKIDMRHSVAARQPA